MSLLHQRSMSGKNVPNWVAILRVVLGVCLIYKGVDFIQHKDQLESFFLHSSTLKSLLWSVEILPWIHIIGGIMILVGLFTRFMSLIQIPIVLGAVVFVNLTEAARVAQSELPLSFLILVLVIVFFTEGGGYMSLDNYIRKPLHEDTDESLA
ncbi:MAG: DoxX family protein [Ferruginibacter sp.]